MPGNFLTVDYGKFAERMIKEEVVKKIKDPSITQWVEPNFTTTTDTDRVCASISLMATLKNYFTYKCVTRCGIPKVTLLGNEEDWKKLRSKINKLLDFEVEQQMADWHDMLSTVIDNFVFNVQGHDTVEFWDHILSNEEGGSGCPDKLTGWATAFCFFDQ